MRALTSAVLLALLALATPGSARAAGIFWDGGAPDDLWHSAANWNTNSVPTIADDVFIGPNPAITVTIQGARGRALHHVDHPRVEHRRVGQPDADDRRDGRGSLLRDRHDRQTTARRSG